MPSNEDIPALNSALKGLVAAAGGTPPPSLVEKMKALDEAIAEKAFDLEAGRDERVAAMKEKLAAARASMEKCIAERPVTNAGQPDRMLQFFAYAHLPEHLQAVSKPFCELAEHICRTLAGNPERTGALRKLMEAKDAAAPTLL